MNDLPMTRARAQHLTRWLKSNYGSDMLDALKHTPFSVDIACAICCKETGIYLVDFIDKMSTADALARCVFDASGDADGTSRSAFPKNTAAFRAEFDGDFADILISEANQTRAIRGMGPKAWVYKGYGLFQYDLQHVRKDTDFFREKKWGIFAECLQRLVSELMLKFKAKGEVWPAVQAYNGSGPRAVIYRSHVEQLTEFCSEA